MNDAAFEFNKCAAVMPTEEAGFSGVTVKQIYPYYKSRHLILVPVFGENEQLDFVFVYVADEKSLVYANSVVDQNAPGSDPCSVLNARQIERLAVALQRLDGNWHLSDSNGELYLFKK
jgi:hypothetical protein